MTEARARRSIRGLFSALARLSAALCKFQKKRFQVWSLFRRPRHEFREHALGWRRSIAAEQGSQYFRISQSVWQCVSPATLVNSELNHTSWRTLSMPNCRVFE